MAIQTIFERYELKFLITEKQKEKILATMKEYMAIDQYGRTTIRNIYYDTESFRLVRHSIDRPIYKEKLRIRSYQKAKPDSTVFIELKKKYESIVYKRRIPMPEEKATDWIERKDNIPENSQISREIDYFLDYYRSLKPMVFLTYEREAYYSLNGDDFRVTFDENVLCRQENVSLEAEVYGWPILEEGMTLMEIKCSGGIPLWMVRILSAEKIYKTSFSKYGAAYQMMIYPKMKEERRYA